MHRPTLTELPPSPPGKTGWPWTAESAQLPATMPDGKPWPRISIVTPSYNQGQFIEETIRSVLLQGYPDLEYIIIDGGSTDNTLQIIKKYELWIDYWVSEKDHGQSHAINKGFAVAHGEIINWLNSDDILLPQALKAVAEGFSGTEEKLGAVVGLGYYVNDHGERSAITPRPSRLDYQTLLEEWGPKIIWQPACYFTREAWERSGRIDEELYFCMDMDLWFKIAKNFKMKKIDAYLAQALSHSDAKTTALREYMAVEHALILLKRYDAEESALFYMKVHLADQLIATKEILRRITNHPIYKLMAFVHRKLSPIKGAFHKPRNLPGNQTPSFCKSDKP